MRKWIGRVFLLIGGFLIGVVVEYANLNPQLESETASARAMSAADADIRQKLMSCYSDRSAQSQQIESMSKAARDVVATYSQMSSANNDIFSEATVLYEPVPQDPRMVTLQTILKMTGHSIALPVVTGMQPRWFIPAKVKPTVYGDPRGMQLVYVDGQGRKEGPFAPEILPQ